MACDKHGALSKMRDISLADRLSVYKELIDKALAEFIMSLDSSKLYPQLRHALLSPGKRLRPILVLLSAECAGGSVEQVLQLALSVELIHTATLVHDDIIDEDEVRRGLPTVHKLWSSEIAILTGDALIALSIKLASSYGEEILRKTAETALMLCEGELIDISAGIKDVSEELYIDMVKRKSASLFKLAAEIGALAVKAPQPLVHALGSFAEYYGVAYQIKDDLEDLVEKSSISKRGMPPLPLIALYNRGDDRLRRKVRDALSNDTSKDSLKELTKAIRAYGIDKYCLSKVEEYLWKAVESLKALGKRPHIECFYQMVKLVNPNFHSKLVTGN